MPGPWYTPDEAVYTSLGRSLYHLGRFEILGQAPDFFSLVYPARAGLPFRLAGADRGHDLLQSV